MDQRDFNRDMDSYLRTRPSRTSSGPRKGFWEQLKSALPTITIEKEEEPVLQEQDSVPVEQVKAVMRGESLPKESPLQEADEEIEEAMQSGPGVFTRFMNWLGNIGSSSHFEGDVPSREEVDYASLSTKAKRAHVDTDVKEMLRICVHWVNMLPPEKIQDIKRSDDFVKFKELLDKYGLLKKKE